VPNGLVGVSNGRLVQTEKGYTTTTYTWETKNPINHYGITINVGAYVHFNDAFVSDYSDTLDLDYYVLSYNENMARTHFQQSKRMLQAFESYFGKYPFYEDGYKLVETPYWGMEHQSCVAYGNNYENNRFGFDFIIIHESGHEWFANSITAKDKADMWIHESFTTYSEALYVEKIFGNPRAIQYLMVQKEKIKNDAPMIGIYGTNHKFNDNDIYYKGSWILHTLRSMIDNDTMWFNTLKDLNTHFYHQTVTTKQVEAFLSKRTRLNLGPFFEQYLRHKELPVLEYFILNKDGLNELHYRLKSKVSTLEMPIKVTLAKEFYDYVYAQTKWRVIDLPYEDASHFKIDVQHFLVNLERVAPR
jgi:aminopeptidase N